jgi:class 3 adenylate cyclase
MLRIKELHDKSQEQSTTLEAQTTELAELNQDLEKRVADQLVELERISHLKRFFSPQLAELIVSSGDDKFMESHRQEITVVFCDLRNFTEFSSTAEPEEQLRVLREYHEVVGSLIFRYEATLEHFAGDGVMSFFNESMPRPDPAASQDCMCVSGESETLSRFCSFSDYLKSASLANDINSAIEALKLKRPTLMG